jgi:probable H4MPT-linked C1 transfer pathway protein
MSLSVVGLDIGGANLKAAHTSGVASLEPFALWKHPTGLTDALRRLLERIPAFDWLAVTMTGELCDCFDSKRQGVQAILDAVAAAAPGLPRRAVRVWRNDGRLVDLERARSTPLLVAAANWLALATYAGRHAKQGPAVLLDIGSTTTDLVPLLDGKPIPRGRTDPERLHCGELVYTGVRRTPLCALLGTGAAGELFATTRDVYLVLDAVPENADDRNTADGRPATKTAAHARLARMMCADLETSTAEERHQLALRAMQRQVFDIGAALEAVVRKMPGTPKSIVTAGSGEFLTWSILESQSLFSPTTVVSLGSLLGVEITQAACAYAVAILASEEYDAGS